MKPIEFKEANYTFAKDAQLSSFKPLPAFKSDDGEVISCWELSFAERVRILFLGNLWSSVMTFGDPLQPIYFTTKKSDLF